MTAERDLPHIILVRPQHEGNVGATARAMANMGLGNLVLVEPAVALGDTAQAFAVGAGHILDASRRVASFEEALAPYGRAVGTSSSRGRRPEVPLLPPRELPARLAADPPGTPTALVFGPETSGLTVDELARLDPLVSVPCAPEQPTLNLSQAVLIVTYELYLARISGGEPAGGTPGRAPASEVEPPAAAGQVEGLFDHLTAVCGRIGFDRDDTFPAAIRSLRRLAARAALTDREVAILRGIARRAQHALDRAED